jgi:hypothetical protein
MLASQDTLRRHVNGDTDPERTQILVYPSPPTETWRRSAGRIAPARPRMGIGGGIAVDPVHNIATDGTFSGELARSTRTPTPMPGGRHHHDV